MNQNQMGPSPNKKNNKQIYVEENKADENMTSQV